MTDYEGRGRDHCPSCGESGDAGSLCRNRGWHDPKTGEWASRGEFLGTAIGLPVGPSGAPPEGGVPC